MKQEGPQVRPPSIKRAERVLDLPVARWQGKCFVIASQFVERGLVRGVAVYGHWLGPIAPGSLFADKANMGFVQHGWVKLQNGQVCDPTRFVFEDVKPYIYIGPADHYDEGGNQVRMALMGPPPPFDGSEEVFNLSLFLPPIGNPYGVVRHVLHLDYDKTEPGIVTASQLHWLANCDPARLEPYAFEIYCALAKLGFVVRIPIDNLRSVERDAGRKVR
jgi:hypothetical protein